jgi:RHS repeat-associated protein
MTDAHGATQYQYDELGRVTRVEAPEGASAYTYDAAGNRTRMTGTVPSPSGTVPVTVDYSYDALNRLGSVTHSSAGACVYTYDLAGNVETLTLPNGLVTRSTYDTLNRLTNLRTTRSSNGAVPLDLTYTYDASGRRTQVSGTVPISSGTVPVTVDYTYDPASRLTGETRAGSSPYVITYAYDKAGNRTQQTRDGTTTVWSVDAANRLTNIRRQGVPSTVAVSVTGTTDATASTVQVFLSPEATNGPVASRRSRSGNTWSANLLLPEGKRTLKVEAKDPLGNTRRALIPVTVTDPTKREFTYDANGNLTEEKQVATEESTRYAYDTLNRLTGVSRLVPGTGTVPGTGFSCTYDGEGKRITTTEGGVTTTYLYDGLLPVLERQGSSTTVNVWGLSLGGGIGGLLARVTPSGALYPLYDGSGNILAWTDSTGAVISTTAYTAFGEVVGQSGTTQAVGFSTKSFSSTTGLSYFGARYYSPSLARWLTPDPLGMVDGPNVYSYVRNNPVNRFDPFGLSTEPGLIDETDVMIDVGSITIGVILPFVDGPLPFGDAAGATLLTKGTTGLARKVRVVIGETMEDVAKAARRIGADYYKPAGRLSPRNWLKANKEWMRRMMKEEREIYDIGIDARRIERSRYYRAEKGILRRKNYPTVEIERP